MNTTNTDTLDRDAFKTRLFGGTDLTYRVDLDAEGIQAFLLIDSLYDLTMQRRHWSAYYASSALMYSAKAFQDGPHQAAVQQIYALGLEEQEIAYEIMARDQLPVDDVDHIESDAVFARVAEQAASDTLYARLLEIRQQLPFLLTDDFFPELCGSDR